MRKLIYAMLSSVDGFMEGPDKDLTWPVIDEEFHRFVNDRERNLDLYLYGRHMYKVMGNYWPTADLDPSNPDYIIEYAQIWKSIPMIVFSRTLEKVEGNARLERQVRLEDIQQLKEQPGKDIGLGGADLASTFIQLGLIDEYQLYIHPVILGQGRPVYQAVEEKIHLHLEETHTFKSGVHYLRYTLAKQVSK
jgi:dihydrofolate reductase